MLINAKMSLFSLQIQVLVLLDARTGPQTRVACTFLNSASTLVIPIHEAVGILYCVDGFVIVRNSLRRASSNL